MKTVRHFPRFGGLWLVGLACWRRMNGWITINKSFVDSFIVGQFQTRSITELVDKATLILFFDAQLHTYMYVRVPFVNFLSFVNFYNNLVLTLQVLLLFFLNPLSFNHT